MSAFAEPEALFVQQKGAEALLPFAERNANGPQHVTQPDGRIAAAPVAVAAARVSGSAYHRHMTHDDTDEVRAGPCEGHVGDLPPEDVQVPPRAPWGGQLPTPHGPSGLHGGCGTAMSPA